MSEPTRILCLGLDEDDCLRFVTNEAMKTHRQQGATVQLVWPTAFMRIAKSEPFDVVIMTDNAAAFPDATLVENWVKVCMLRVKDADGLTAGQRLVAGEA